MTLKVGLTSYKDYLATNTDARPVADLTALRRDGLSSHGATNAHLSCALGVETVLETADGGIVLLRRSAHVATFNGLYNGPSGRGAFIYYNSRLFSSQLEHLRECIRGG